MFGYRDAFFGYRRRFGDFELEFDGRRFRRAHARKRFAFGIGFALGRSSGKRRDGIQDRRIVSRRRRVLRGIGNVFARIFRIEFFRRGFVFGGWLLRRLVFRLKLFRQFLVRRQLLRLFLRRRRRRRMSGKPRKGEERQNRRFRAIRCTTANFLRYDRQTRRNAYRIGLRRGSRFENRR